MPSRRALLATALLGGAAACAPGPAPPPQTPAVVAPKVVPAIPELGRAAPEATVSALVEACVAPQTGDVERARITQYLASIKSAAGGRCYLHALREYRPGVTDEIVGVASEAVAALRIEAARGPLFEAFAKMRASRSHGAYRAVYEAMVALADPAWEGRLVAYLDRPVDPKDPPALTDEMFWQQTAVVVLGRLRSAAAVRPLLRVLVTEDKAPAHLDALLALIRIGKPAVMTATALLRKADPELLAYAGPGRAVATAALVLATMGRAESLGPMIDALSEPDPATRALVARELPKLPADPRAVAAYRGVVEKLPLTVTIPQIGRPAREDLVERAAEFFDASLVPWLADDARRLKGARTDVRVARETALLAALELARADQVKHIDAIAALDATIAKDLRKEIAITKELLGACGDRVDCWFQVLRDSASQKEGSQFRGVKAGYMIGALGDDAAKARLVSLLPRLTDPVVRSVVGLAIEHLSPQGDSATAAALQMMVDDVVAMRNERLVRLNAPLKLLIHRLQSRVP